MALFSKGEAEEKALELIHANATLKAKLEVKDELLQLHKDQVVKLEHQVEQLQLALVWKEAPAAAQERLDLQDQAKDDAVVPSEAAILHEKVAKVNGRLLASIEGDLFEGPEDMMRAIGGVKAEELMDKLFQEDYFGTPPSIHDNGES